MAAISSWPTDRNLEARPTAGLPALSTLPKSPRRMDASSLPSGPPSEIQHGSIGSGSGLGRNWSTPYPSSRTWAKENSPYARQTMVVEPGPPAGRGHLVLTLFDSGSDAELISKSFVENSGLARMVNRLSTPRSLVGIGGGLTVAKEEIMLQWTFSNKSPTLPLHCFVAERGLGDFDLLLGRGFLFEHSILVLQAPRLFESEPLSVAVLTALKKGATADDIRNQIDHQITQMDVQHTDADDEIEAERYQREMMYQHDKPPQYSEIALDMSHRQSEDTLRQQASPLDGSTNVPGSEISQEDAKLQYPGQSDPIGINLAKSNLEVSEASAAKVGSALPHPDGPPKIEAEPAERLLPEQGGQPLRKPGDQGSPKQEEQNLSEKPDQNMPNLVDQSLLELANPNLPKPMDQTQKDGQALAKSEHFSEQITDSASRAAGVVDHAISKAASKSPGSDSTSPPDAAEPNANHKMQQGQSESTATVDNTIPIALGIGLPAPVQGSTVHEDSEPSAPNAGSQPEQRAGPPALSPSGTEISEAETAVEGNSPALTTGEYGHDKDAGATQPDSDNHKPSKRFAALAV